MYNLIKLKGQNLSSKIIGNKAFNLNKLIALGFKVPETFVLNSQIFDNIRLEFKIETLLQGLSLNSDSEQLLSFYKEIQKTKVDITNALQSRLDFDLIKHKNIAIRSSTILEDGLSTSWAGQFDTFLNVSKEQYIDKIIDCWFSLYSERALKYGSINNTQLSDFKIAVILQEMIDSECSGVLFTSNPITKRSNEMVIEAGLGLGEAIVSGNINVDKYLIEKDTLKMSKSISRKNKKLVTNKKGGTNWEYVLNEKQGIECLEESKVKELFEFAIKIETSFQQPVDIEWGLQNSDFYFFQTRPITNFQERLMVSHQSDLLTQDLVLSGIFLHCDYRKYGLSFKHPYIKYDHDTGDIFYPSWQVKEFEKLTLPLAELQEIALSIENTISEYSNYLNKFKENLQSNKEHYTALSTFFSRSLYLVSTITYFHCFEIVINRMLIESGVSPHMIPSSITKTFEASSEINKLRIKYDAEFKQYQNHGLDINDNLLTDLNEIASKYGFLGLLYFKGNPWDSIDVLKMAISGKNSKPKQEPDKKLSSNSKLIQLASKFLRLRTEKWEIMCYSCSLFREYMILHYSHITNYDRLLKLRIPEVLSIVSGTLPSALVSNNRDNFILEIQETKVYLKENAPKTSDESERKTKENSFQGTIACKGLIQGTVVVVLSAREQYKFNEGDILVTKMSTPDFLPIMQKAAAFITEIGGVTSHAAIVARELNKPCIIGVKNITKLLRNGDYVKVDANRGEIILID